MPRKDAGGGPISAQAQQDLVSEGIENFELPKSLVTRIAKSAIPDSAKLQKETVLSLVKGSTVFINYLAATAHDVALSKQHKSISASDVLKALEMIEFGDLIDKLHSELQLYRDNAKGDKGRKGGTGAPHKGKAKESESAITEGSPSTSASGVGSASGTAGRGKGKERVVLPPPFTTAARAGGAAPSISSSASVAHGSAGEQVPNEEIADGAGASEDEDEGMGEPRSEDGEEAGEAEVEVGSEGEGDYDDGEGDENPMVIEDEELARDARGLGDSSSGPGEDGV